MELAELRQLPDEARVWIQGFRAPLKAEDRGRISQVLNRLFESWKSHGFPVQAAFTILHDRFVVTAAACDSGLSGCSIDLLFRSFKDLRDNCGLDGLDGSLIYFRNAAGEIQALEHLKFYEVVASGAIEEETPVFDLQFQRLGDLRRGVFEKPFKSSWHSRTYGRPTAKQ